MSGPWRDAILIEEKMHRELRMRMIFEHFKCDPQAEDVDALSRVALVLDAGEWRSVCRLAQDLSREVLAAEQELLGRGDLLRELAIPRAIRRAMQSGSAAASAARVMRFDFHYSTDGWRITEVNSDVPGGFIEGSAFTRCVAEALGHPHATGDAARAYAQALSAPAPGGVVALVHATAYMDDRQVMMFLARELESRGCNAILCAPDQVRWDDGIATICTAWYAGRADLVMRFFPAEWLANLPRRSGWRGFFSGTLTPQSNPGYALISQSKRLPLLYERLATAMPTWRQLLPETRDPRDGRGEDMSRWVIKPAMGRVGDGVLMAGATPAKEARSINRWSRWFPGRWIAQRRFETVPLNTPAGRIYPCLGVYTVDGVAAGAYARVAATPLIDARASDAAVLLDGAQQHAASTERVKGAA